MYDINAISAELRRRFEAAAWGPIDIVMKKSGDAIRITPCTLRDAIEGEADVEFFLMDSTGVNLYGEGCIGAVAATLARYDAIKTADAEARKALRAIKAELEDPDPSMTMGEWELLYGSYSDRSKEIYGHRLRDVVRPARMGSWDDPRRLQAADEAARAMAARA